MDFSFYTSHEIIFGRGKIAQLPEIAGRFGRRVLLISRGRFMQESGCLERIKQAMKSRQLEMLDHTLPAGEPTVTEVDETANLARELTPDVIVGLGGGSSIDTAKAAAGMAVHPGSVADYLEGVGSLRIKKPGIPLIAIPTTAGTGAEVTKNAVISGVMEKYKKSLRSSHLVSRIALLDPELTYTMPASLTAETGMDAFTQLVESFISNKAQPIPQALALYGIKLVDKYLAVAVRHPDDPEAREAMQLAALLSGMALANSGLGAAHGIAAALGALCHIPHGRACAVLLPHVLEFNLPSCITAYSRLYSQLSDFTVDSELAAAEAFVTRVDRLTREINIPKAFSAEEVPADQLPE
ncbi:MAG TPA: iron-containing alcohol dehydrogenase, partial [bacterium]|nr:iron-containing alcohol dehydrogenase [bacterium]